jgi:serine/threonine protein kinase
MHMDRPNSTIYSDGEFGEIVVKRFPKEHAVNGFTEYNRTSRISELDQESHGGRPKYIVTVSSTGWDPMADFFAFSTPRAMCTYADFLKDGGRAPKLTKGFALNRIVRAVMYLRSINASHGDIKPDNIFLYRGGYEIVLADFGHYQLFLKGHDFRRQTASGTHGYRHPWPADLIHPQIGDIFSLAVVFANTLIPKGRAHLLSEDARIAIGQKHTTQDVFEKFVESKIRGPAGSTYVPYLLPALRRYPHSLDCPMAIDPVGALASLLAATKDMMANEKAEPKRRRENQVEARPIKRCKLPGAPPTPVPLAPEQPFGSNSHKVQSGS